MSKFNLGKVRGQVALVKISVQYILLAFPILLG